MSDYLDKARAARKRDLARAENIARKHGYTVVQGHHCHPLCDECARRLANGQLPLGREYWRTDS